MQRLCNMNGKCPLSFASVLICNHLALVRCLPACSGCLKKGGKIGQVETVLADLAMVAARAK